MAKIARKFMAHYINAAIPEDGEEMFELLGEDLEEFSAEMSAKVDKKQNILGETDIIISGYEKTAEVATYYANPQTMTDIDITKVDALTDSVQGLETVITRLHKSIASAFSLSALASFTDRALTASGRLKKELLVLRLSFGSLRAAIGDAVAPLGGIFIPMLSRAMFAVTRFVRYIGEIIAALMGVESVSKVTAKAVSSVYGSLADFDKIDRLKGGTGVLETVKEEVIILDLWQKLLVSKVKTLLAPLQNISFSGAVDAFGELKEAMAPITRQLFSGLEWAWYNLLVPLGNWVVTEVLPVFLEVLASALDTLNATIQAAKPYLEWFWENYLQPLAQWAGDRVVKYLEDMKFKLDDLTLWIRSNEDVVRKMTRDLVEFIGAWAVEKLTQFGNEATGLTAVLLNLAGGMDNILDTGGQFSEMFVMLKNIFKGGANGVLGAVNGMLSGSTTGINNMIGLLNKLKFTIPEWVPIFGGKKFDLNLETITPPQIPYLAKGAVLPANKPFLAMVGDQRHGTNVEAPLATIQEAVRLSLDDLMSGNMAGHEATVSVLEQLLAAVQSIRIGDDAIAAACDRSRTRQAVIRGNPI